MLFAPLGQQGQFVRLAAFEQLLRPLLFTLFLKENSTIEIIRASELHSLKKISPD